MSNTWRPAGRVLSAILVSAALLLPASAFAEEGDPEVLALMHEINAQLADLGLNYAVEQIDFFTIGGGRSANRIHQTGARWVPDDARRLAQGDDITYWIDESDGATASGLSSADTTTAIGSALETWNDSHCTQKVEIVNRPDDGQDPDILDAIFGFGGFGNLFAADIVNAGFLPKAYFDAVGGPGGGEGILAFSVSFIFINPDGSPSDVNGDNYIDRAANELYYNDNFGDPNGTRPGNPWGIDIDPPGIDVETVALHESGHSLGLGHFGPPPAAVMNPVYAGINQDPDPIDNAGMCALYSSWPNP